MLLVAGQAKAAPTTSDARPSIGTHVAALGRFPGAVGELGGLVSVDRSLWLGSEYSFGQLRAEWVGLLGVGASATVYGATAPTLRFDFLPGCLLSLEIQVGPMLGLQAGSAGLTPVAGLLTMGGWALRPLADQRYVFKLSVIVLAGTVLRDDPSGNDCPTCYGAIAGGLAFELPLEP